MTSEKLTDAEREALLHSLVGTRAVAAIDNLTEALAAAERNHVESQRNGAEVNIRLKAAERDRDAANALLRDVRREYNNAPESTRLNRISAVLSSQPAAPTRAEATVVWRGSVGDLVTDLSPLLGDEKLRALHAELARRGLK